MQVALTNLPQEAEDQYSIVAKISVFTELARLCCQRKQFDEAENFYLKSNYAALEFFKSYSEAFSLQVSQIIGLLSFDLSLFRICSTQEWQKSNPAVPTC